MFPSLHVYGNLISEDKLKQVFEGTLDGQSSPDFGFAQGTRLNDEIEYAWSRAKLAWAQFSKKREAGLGADQYGTTVSRKFMQDLMAALGFTLIQNQTGLLSGSDKSYAISHKLQEPLGLPVHIAGFMVADDKANSLDMKSSGGTSRLSPHSMVHEYLNETEHLWGMVANGLSLRVIRDSGKLARHTYLDFNLQLMFTQDMYADFCLLFRLIHVSRFGSTGQTENCWLEEYFRLSIEAGNKIRDGLSLAVKQSLLLFGQGFLAHEDNEHLRQAFASGKLTSREYYRELLRLVYRLLFLMVAEERNLIYDNTATDPDTLRFSKLYKDFYSLTRIRKLSTKRYLQNGKFNDIWLSLVDTFRLFETTGHGKKLGIEPLGGELFSDYALLYLKQSSLDNETMLKCINSMHEFQLDGQLTAVNYGALDVEELGSVYEGLLDLHAHVAEIHGVYTFTFFEGTDRKTTGSYYTRPELVHELIKSALLPVVEERLAANRGNKEAQEKALLNLKVCDPAAGSGHMLLAAARAIAWELARLRTGEDNPAPAAFRTAQREVIQHCIYAVDYNPDAVELCKLALWLESHVAGKPLSFLDHKVKNGNSLVGVTDLKVLEQPLPDEAFSEKVGDVKEVVKALKNDNKNFRIKKQLSLFGQGSAALNTAHSQWLNSFREVETMPQDAELQVREMSKRYKETRSHAFHEEMACHIWTAAFFKQYIDIKDPKNPSSEKLLNYFNAPSQFGELAVEATRLAKEFKFFHWPVEFPDVWAQGGFDVMLGNPPWEIVELKEEEFFATSAPEILGFKKAARSVKIKELKETRPLLHAAYEEALRMFAGSRSFLRNSNRMPLTAHGRVNMYSVFAETFLKLIQPKGYAGIIVPTGIATDDGNKEFFGHLVDEKKLVSLFDFENREQIFQSVDSRYKFCLITVSGKDIGAKTAQFAFFLTRTEHLQDKLRVFGLTKVDFLRLNPNTKTSPILRTSIDAALISKIYERVPILINEETSNNPWGISFRQGLFNMSSDSHLFKTKDELDAMGYSPWGNKMVNGDEVWLPLYEGKMCHYFNHRATEVYFNHENKNRQVQQRETSLSNLEKPEFVSQPAYFVKSSEVDEIVGDVNYFLGFKSVTSPTNERTFIASIFPHSGVGNSLPLILTPKDTDLSLLYANSSSMVIDYISKIKVGGVNLNFFYVKQFPFLRESDYTNNDLYLIRCLVLELTYTSWDIKAFANDVWNEADADLREAIRQQWAQNQGIIGGHPWSPPEWSEDYDTTPETTTGCPLPPFKWDEDRRALLRAKLDAIYAKLYGLTYDELRYILDPQDVYGPDFPGETFRVLKDKEMKAYGEYRTRRLVLEAWREMGYGE